jgi:short-subunit dehydrogenase
MTQTFFRDRTVLITGASSGIGKELAIQLGQAGAKLMLTARRKNLLEDLAQRIAASGKPRPLVVEADVTRDGDLERAVAETMHQWGRLDVVIANAGFQVIGGIKKLSLQDYRRQFETNVFGVLRTVYAALPEVEKARGNIAIVGSLSGWSATPGSSAYAMGKFAVRALANAITPELALSGVKVTLVTPGLVASNIRRTDNQGRFRADAKGHSNIPAWLEMPTEKAARQILSAVARGKREAILSGHARVLVVIERFMPWLLRIAARTMATASRQPSD